VKRGDVFDARLDPVEGSGTCLLEVSEVILAAEILAQRDADRR
jgi:hypothetical protein